MPSEAKLEELGIDWHRGPSVAAVTVKLSAALSYPAGQADAECRGATVAEVIADCCAGRPGLAQHVLGDGGEQLVGIFLNGRSVRQMDGLRTPVSDGDEIRLTPPIAGGQARGLRPAG